MNKEEILSEYRRIRAELGRKPTAKHFYKLAGLPERWLIKHYRTFGDLVKEAGDEPVKVFKRVYTEEDYIRSYVNFLREHKRIPTTGDWEHYELKPRLGSYSTKFKKRWSELPLLVYERIADRYDLLDVRRILEKELGIKVTERTRDSFLRTDSAEAKRIFMENLDEELKLKVPQIVLDLVWLAYSSTSGREFEERCGTVLSMLGFEVTPYGQGSGRKPDGIAADPINRYAVIYDAKSRQSHYTAGTDDRQVIEYIREERKSLLAQGYDVVYFLMISSAFGRISPQWSFNVRSETGVCPSFITAENLLNLLAVKIECPRSFDLLKLKRLLVPGGEIRDAQSLKFKV